MHDACIYIQYNKPCCGLQYLLAAMTTITRTSTGITVMIIAANSTSPTTKYVVFTPPSTGVRVILTDTILEVTVARHTHTHIRTHTHAHTHAHMHTRTHTHTHKHTHTHTHTHTQHTHARMHARTCAHTHTEYNMHGSNIGVQNIAYTYYLSDQCCL